MLLVSAELEEVTSLADRLLIIHEGRIVGEVDPKVATIEEIGLLMTRGHYKGLWFLAFGVLAFAPSSLAFDSFAAG